MIEINSKFRATLGLIFLLFNSSLLMAQTLGEKGVMPPITFSFNSQTEFNDWTVINVNSDTKTWLWNAAAGTPSGGARYSFHATNTANDWMISPSIQLQNGVTYRLTFQTKNSNTTTTERVRVYYGKGNTAALQTTQLGEFVINNGAWSTKTINFTPTSSGDFNFGFYAYSAPNQFFLDIDNVTIERLVDNDLSAISVTGPALVKVDKQYPYNVIIKNIGTQPQSSYKVVLCDINNVVLAESLVSENLAPANSKTVSVIWTPTTEGEMQIKGKVVLVNDEEPANDATLPIPVFVEPFNEFEIISIGTGTNGVIQIPINYFYYLSNTQTIYLGSEIGYPEGVIRTLTYSYNSEAPSETGPQPLRIYIAHTPLENLSGGWIPFTSFELVYSGTVDIPVGISELQIELDKPFVYRGGNICIYSEKSSYWTYNRVYALTTPTTNSRSRYYNSNSVLFNFSQPGTAMNALPNIKVKLNTNLSGSLSGTVTKSGNPIANVKVKLMPYQIEATTNASGVYSFPHVPAYEYTLVATFQDHHDVVMENINVGVSQHVTIDFQIVARSYYSVNGYVKNTDGNGIAGAKIDLFGYKNYQTTSAANGYFEFSNVIYGNSYDVSIKSGDYITYQTNIDIHQNTNLGDIQLQNYPHQPRNVKAEYSVTNATVSWVQGFFVNEFRYDNGVCKGQAGFRNGDATAVMGPVHKTPTLLYDVKWWTRYDNDRNTGGPHDSVNLFIFDLDALGKPTNRVLFIEKNIPNIDDQWVTFTFQEPINCPNGFMMALSFDGYVSIGTTLPNQIYPYIPNSHYYSTYYPTETFATLESVNMSFNHMIRGYGLPSKVDFIENSQAAGMLGYNVWRMKFKDKYKPENWTSLTPNYIQNTTFPDVDFANLDSGFYCYAIRAYYFGDVMSEVSFSNRVTLGFEVPVTINLSTNSGDNPNGTMVFLTNLDEESVHNYTFTISELPLVVPHIWKGSYKVTASLMGFEIYIIPNLEILSETIIDIELKEKINIPYQLNVSVVEKHALFSWKHILGNGFFDDFEEHVNFTINSSGSAGWSYIDGDEMGTYGIEGIAFPHSGEPMANIIFNPSQTVPSMGGSANIAPSSGQKLSASFGCGASKPNDDWIITPELSFADSFVFAFKAKSFVPTFGLERMRVLYSTTGKNKEDFIIMLNPPQYIEVPSTEWNDYSFKLPGKAKYVAIHCMSFDAFILLIDDVSIGIESKSDKSFKGYSVFLNGNEVAQDQQERAYLFANLANGSYTAGVKANYASGSTELQTINFVINVDDINENQKDNIKIYPNPAISNLTIEGLEQVASQAIIFNSQGEKIIAYYFTSDKFFLPTQMLSAGIYFVQIINGKRSVIKKIIKATN